MKRLSRYSAQESKQKLIIKIPLQPPIDQKHHHEKNPGKQQQPIKQHLSHQQKNTNPIVSIPKPKATSTPKRSKEDLKKQVKEQVEWLNSLEIR